MTTLRSDRIIGSPAWESRQANEFLPLIPMTQRILYSRLQQADADDCQAAMRAAMVRSLRSWRKERGMALKSWVIFWIRGAAKEWARKRWLRDERLREMGLSFVSLDHPHEDEAAWLEAPSDDLTPEEAALRECDRDLAAEQIIGMAAALNPRDRYLIWLLYFEGLRQIDAAERVGLRQRALSRTGVSEAHCRALDRMRVAADETR